MHTTTINSGLQLNSRQLRQAKEEDWRSGDRILCNHARNTVIKEIRAAKRSNATKKTDSPVSTTLRPLQKNTVPPHCGRTIDWLTT